MTGKRYKSVGANLECPNGKEYILVKRDDGFNVCQVCSKYTAKEIVDELNNLADENEQLKKENNKLHQKIFEMRTNIALERTEISKQTYTGKKNEKEYLDAKEFLDEIEKW